MSDRRQGDRRETSVLQRKVSISLSSFIYLCIIFVLIFASVIMGIVFNKNGYNTGYEVGYIDGYEDGYGYSHYEEISNEEE